MADEKAHIFVNSYAAPGNEDLVSPEYRCAKCYILFKVCRIKWDTPNLCPSCNKEEENKKPPVN